MSLKTCSIHNASHIHEWNAGFFWVDLQLQLMQHHYSLSPGGMHFLATSSHQDILISHFCDAQDGLVAGGAVTIEELILGLQGSLGSTPEAFRTAAEHLVRIGGALLSPFPCIFKLSKGKPFTLFTQVISLPFKSYFNAQ